MIVNTSSKFQREFSEVVKNVMLPSLLSYIAKPLVFFKPIRTNVFPEQWEAGDYLVRMYLFYFIPFGEQTIRIELLKSKVEDEFILRDNGFGTLIKKWDHWIFIKKTDETGQIIYTDRVDIDAGILTPFIWIYAFTFYHWRQYRWRKLIRRNFKDLNLKKRNSFK